MNGPSLPYHPMEPEESDELLASVDSLIDDLSSGTRPQPIDTDLRLSAGEECYAVERCLMHQFLEGDATYVHRHTSGIGPRALLGKLGDAVGNEMRRRRAEVRAEPHFQPVDTGNVYLTNLRFAVQGEAQWSDLWFEYIRMSACDERAIYLDLPDEPRVALEVPGAPFYFVLFHWLDRGDIVRPGLGDA